MAAYRSSHAISKFVGNLRNYNVGLTVSHTPGLYPSCSSRVIQYPHRDNDVRILQARHMSGRGGFFKQFLENLQQDFEKNKEMKENLKKFREERKKLEESESVQEARKKYDKIQAETLTGSAALKEKLDALKETAEKQFEEVQKSELGKKAGEFGQTISEGAGRAAEVLGKSGDTITKTAAFQNISKGVSNIKSELDESTIHRAKMYRPPAELRTRKAMSTMTADRKPVEADSESTGMVMHKDSKWHQSWQDFKDNNQYLNKMFEMKMRYDESDHVVVRLTRGFTDKMSQMFGNMFSKTEMSEVLTEICKMDPGFNKEHFIRDCENIFIPNILEAMVRGELEILKDWCYEAPFNVLSHPIKQAKSMGLHYESRVLDVTGVDIVAGKMMEQGPVLVISFNAQQIQVVKDSAGNVREGDPDKVLRVLYVWAMCRDQEELDPQAAWKLMDISASSTEQWL